MFYSNDHEPIHVHVAKGGVQAKFSIMPVRLVKNDGLTKSELKLAEAIIEENEELIKEHWERFFKNDKAL